MHTQTLTTRLPLGQSALQTPPSLGTGRDDTSTAQLHYKVDSCHSIRTVREFWHSVRWKSTANMVNNENLNCSVTVNTTKDDIACPL